MLSKNIICLRAAGSKGGGGGGGTANVLMNFGKDSPRRSRSAPGKDKKGESEKRNRLWKRRFHKWLSPPDPSMNHNNACAVYHKGTAAWFFQGNIFQEWKGSASLLWIHGICAPCLTSSLTPL